MCDQKDDRGLSEQLHAGILQSPKDAGTTPNTHQAPPQPLLWMLDFSSSAVTVKKGEGRGKGAWDEGVSGPRILWQS